MPVDYYKSLGVSQTASSSEIKSRYKELAKIHHPDMKGDAKKMVVINKAYGVLSDPKKRYDYNRSVIAPIQPAARPAAGPKKSARPAQPKPASAEGIMPFTSGLLGRIIMNPIGLFALLFLILLLAGYLGSGANGG